MKLLFAVRFVRGRRWRLMLCVLLRPAIVCCATLPRSQQTPEAMSQALKAPKAKPKAVQDPEAATRMRKAPKATQTKPMVPDEPKAASRASESAKGSRSDTDDAEGAEGWRKLPMLLCENRECRRLR